MLLQPEVFIALRNASQDALAIAEAFQTATQHALLKHDAFARPGSTVSTIQATRKIKNATAGRKILISYLKPDKSENIVSNALSRV